MQENLLKNKDTKNFKSAEKYLLKYLFDLQNHFSLTNTEIIKILHSSLNVVKKDNRPKRWWKIFQKTIQ